jgi:hypothetical protein
MYKIINQVYKQNTSVHNHVTASGELTKKECFTKKRVEMLVFFQKRGISTPGLCINRCI